jgi:hypothetical protein
MEGNATDGYGRGSDPAAATPSTSLFAGCLDDSDGYLVLGDDAKRNG